MLIKIDYDSEEALYLQVRNQIILGIACSKIREGDSLPSVRQMAEYTGINMHTVNKAYTVLKQDGFVRVDRRKGVVVAVSINERQAHDILKKDLLVTLAKSSCQGVSRAQVHQLIDEIYDEYGGV